MTRGWWDGTTRAAVLAAMLGFSVAASAVAQTTTDEGVWTAVSVRGEATHAGEWRWAADTLARSRDGVGALDFLFEHVTLMRAVGDQGGVGIGYGFGAGFLEEGTLLEHRVTQQVVWNGGRRTRISVRTLLEERFITDRDLKVRARGQVRVSWPIAARGRLRAVVSEELLMQADARRLSAVRLDSNRMFIGVGRAVTPGSVMEVGYLNVYARSGASRHQRNHVMSASLALSLGGR